MLTDPSGKCWALLAPVCAYAGAALGSGGIAGTAATGTAAIGGTALLAPAAILVGGAALIAYPYTYDPNAEANRQALSRGAGFVANGGKGYV